MGVSVFGGVLLVWGTLRIFRGLDTAFSDIYESGGENDLPDQILDGLVVLLTVVVGAVVETRLGGLSAAPDGWIARRLLLVAGLALVVLFGAVLSAVLTNWGTDVSICPVVGGVPPSQSTSNGSNDDVTDRIRLLGDRLADGHELTVEVTGEPVTLPPPTSVEVTTDSHRLAAAGSSPLLCLVWSAAAGGDG